MGLGRRCYRDLLSTDEAAAPICAATDGDVVAETITYVDSMAFAERVRRTRFTEDAGEEAFRRRWSKDTLILDGLAMSREALGFTNICY